MRRHRSAPHRPVHHRRGIDGFGEVEAYKPRGSADSAIEMALWDIAGKASGVPVHQLLGGKVRDRVRIRNGGVRAPMTGQQPEDYAAAARLYRDATDGFTIVKDCVEAMKAELGDGIGLALAAGRGAWWRCRSNIHGRASSTASAVAALSTSAVHRSRLASSPAGDPVRRVAAGLAPQHRPTGRAGCVRALPFV